MQLEYRTCLRLSLRASSPFFDLHHLQACQRLAARSLPVVVSLSNEQSRTPIVTGLTLPFQLLNEVSRVLDHLLEVRLLLNRFFSSGFHLFEVCGSFLFVFVVISRFLLWVLICLSWTCVSRLLLFGFLVSFSFIFLRRVNRLLYGFLVVCCLFLVGVCNE